MEGIGAEVSQKIRSAIKAKLMEIGVYVDEELPDYVMVMVANKRSKDQMDDDLQLFLGKHTSLFTTWLHQVLQKLQEVTVANLGGTKRKLSEDSKKKKKTKQDSEKKDLKKKIKVEPEDNNKKELCSKKNEDNKGKKDVPIKDNCSAISSRQLDEITGPKGREKNDLKTASNNQSEQVKDSKIVSKNDEELECSTVNSNNRQKSEEHQRGIRSKSHSTSSHTEDLDDEDCINIRTDGELLDTAEEVNTDEPSKKTTKKKDSPICEDNDKASEDLQTSLHQSPVKKNKLKPEDEINRPSKKEAVKKQSVPQESPPSSNEKIIDARDLLNRKKASKLSDNRTRNQSRDRSVSPQRKRKDGDRDSTVRVYHDDKDANRRTGKDDERKSCSRKVSRDDDRDRRNTRERDFHSSKRRGEDRTSRRSDNNRIESRENRRRDLSNETQLKRLKLDKQIRNKNEDWDSARSSKMVSVGESRKVEIESSVKRKDLEEIHKRSGLVSRVVPRPVEPEDNLETPVPSVVKVTPRPRRPPSQQPSSTLIIKAISEANKSLANMAQRPDSTQRTRRDPVFARTLRQLERIPPEKIAVSITNSLALQNESPELKDEDVGHRSPAYDESAVNRSPPSNLLEATSSEPDNFPLNEINLNEEWNKEEKMEEESHAQEIQGPEPEHTAGLRFEQPMEETGDPQFVVTLNGYDPDGLYTQNVLDLGDEGDSDDWLKINVDEEQFLTSTPDEIESPRPKRDNKTPPIALMNTPTPAVNHSNLIEVELVQAKSTERCKYWPACRLADKCIYYHPSKPCKLFPACKFGDACLYIHPQCKFNALCTRKDCVFSHTPAYTPLQPAALPKIKTLYAASAPLPCKFYPNCTNINCQFTHPPRACRFGLYCTKKDCVFHHGQVPPVDKLKWTRVQAT